MSTTVDDIKAITDPQFLKRLEVEMSFYKLVSDGRVEQSATWILISTWLRVAPIMRTFWGAADQETTSAMSEAYAKLRAVRAYLVETLNIIDNKDGVH
jgi:hypothetical protein